MCGLPAEVTRTQASQIPQTGAKNEDERTLMDDTENSTGDHSESAGNGVNPVQDTEESSRRPVFYQSTYTSSDGTYYSNTTFSGPNSGVRIGQLIIQSHLALECNFLWKQFWFADRADQQVPGPMAEPLVSWLCR